jgi:hypothetical protein
MKKIFSKQDPEHLLAVINKKESITNERTDLAGAWEPLQGSTKKLKAGDRFKPHRHNSLIRETDITQEAWIILEGKIKITLYDLDDSLFFEEELGSGDCLLTFRGGHTFEVLENDTLLYEFKNGPYLGVEADKTLINES